MVPASLGCFLVIESRAHAASRGATPYAHVAAIASDRCRRAPGEALANATRQYEPMQRHIDPGASAVISGATGVAAPTGEEREFLGALRLPVRASGTALGHSMEPSFPANLALAAIAVSRGRLFGPLEPEEEPMSRPLRSVLVTGWGHWRGEGMAVVEAA
jgi:3-oxoacyl-[acyl-carrier-protein] synthase II